MLRLKLSVRCFVITDKIKKHWILLLISEGFILHFFNLSATVYTVYVLYIPCQQYIQQLQYSSFTRLIFQCFHTRIVSNINQGRVQLQFTPAPLYWHAPLMHLHQRKADIINVISLLLTFFIIIIIPAVIEQCEKWLMTWVNTWTTPRP